MSRQFILGQPYMRGNSDESTSYAYGNTRLEGGLAVSMGNNGAIKAYDGTGAVVGVTSSSGIGAQQTVYMSAMEMCVQQKGVATINVGDTVSIQNDGTFGTGAGIGAFMCVQATQECLEPMTNSSKKGILISLDTKGLGAAGTFTTMKKEEIKPVEKSTINNIKEVK